MHVCHAKRDRLDALCVALNHKRWNKPYSMKLSIVQTAIVYKESSVSTLMHIVQRRHVHFKKMLKDVDI